VEYVSETIYETVAASKQPEEEEEEEEGGETYAVVLHNDDWNTFDDIINLLKVVCGLKHSEALKLTKEIDTEGHGIVKESQSRAECEQLRASITELSDNLIVSVKSVRLRRREETSRQILVWLGSFCGHSDGLCCLFSEALLIDEPSGPRASQVESLCKSRLDAWIVADSVVPKGMSKALHVLYMKLIIDPSFKIDFAKAFVRLYAVNSSRLIEGKGTQDDSIFNFSVQIFTVPSLVPLLVKEEELLAVLFSCLAAAFTSALDHEGALNIDHGIFRHSRYMHLVNDLKYVLSMPDIGPMVIQPGSPLLPIWLQIMSFVQGMDAVTRQVGTHVEFESESWLRSFDLTVRLSPVNSAIVAGFIDGIQADVNAGMISSEEPLHRVCAVIRMAVDALSQWAVALQRRQGQEEVDLPTPHGTVRGLQANVLNAPVSFHLPLHRFVSLLLTQSLLHLGLSPRAVLRAYHNPEFLDLVPPARLLADLLEYPLEIGVCTAQVRAGLWRRNGNSLLNQSLNYHGSPIAAHMLDLDLPLLRIAAATTPPHIVVTRILHRFGLLEWWLDPTLTQQDLKGGSGPPLSTLPAEALCRGEGPTLVQMSEECLALLIVLFAEIHRYQPNGPSSCLRQELIHRLCVGPCAHSEFVECITSLSRSRLEIECRMEELDEVFYFRNTVHIW